MKTKPIMLMILFIAMISVSFFNFEPVSAATIKIQPSSYYNTTDISLNDQIQKLINSAKDGDTLDFIGKYYGNLSLIISKSLNIVSNVNTTVSGDSSGNSVFLVTGNSSKWTNITGFNIKSVNNGITVNSASNITVSNNTVSSSKGTGIKVSKSSGVKVKNNTVTSSKTGISISNSSHSSIQGNKVKKSTNNGIDIQQSHEITVSNNDVSYNGKHGTSIANSNNIDLERNNIENNQNNGLNLINTNNIQINNNTISNNQIHGVYFDTNVKNTQITYNTITNNLKSGIELDGSGSNTKINYNSISGNAIGINVNSHTDNLEIGQNSIIFNKGYDEDSGIGINFGGNYVGSSTMTISSNAIYGNDRREVCASDIGTKVNIGYNWYGSDASWQVRVCPYITANLITWATTESNGQYTTVFYAGDQVASTLPDFDLTYQLNNGTKVTVTVKNGIAKVKFPSNEYKSTGNKLTVQAAIQKKIMSIIDEEVQNILNYQNQNNANNGNKGGSGDNGKGNNGNGKGNGNSNNGNGNSNGNTNGNGNPPGNTGQIANGNAGGSSGQSGSTSKLERNSAMLDGAGEAAQSSSNQNKASDQQTKKAQEILLDNVNNPNLWSVVALVILIVAIIMLYYRKEIELMCRK